ncbi:PREDICTED: uncharacterized protein LOC107331827 isoform X1 [Acropora digitifera]|uniref:uncharacterized protein LOC107331827 isoform X1 n=1 Tax=Acropora digitifera TaxID=70779 RepID=UPI00077A5480|nr:PREDICTED: uncharacterized protein LOC107331827 isoform X1 [Acropora digitifera]
MCFKKCCVNPIRKEMTAMSKMLGKMDMVVDKLQCRNHVDRWCKANCNPHDRNELRGVQTKLRKRRPTLVVQKILGGVEREARIRKTSETRKIIKPRLTEDNE